MMRVAVVVMSLLIFTVPALRNPHPPPLQPEIDLDLPPAFLKSADRLKTSDLEIPPWLVGWNVVTVGDSNERFAAQLLCGKGKFVTKHPMRNVRVKPQVFCDLDAFNVTVMSFRHPGVMSLPPQPLWHTEKLQRVANRNVTIPVVGGRQILAATDIVPLWKEAMQELLPSRPTVMLVQSSLWDSEMAFEFLQDRHLPYTFEQSTLEDFGWQSGVNDLEAIGWTTRASAFIDVIKASMSSIVETMIWRTNPNCPNSAPESRNGPRSGFLGIMHEAQAKFVRDAISSEAGSWEGVRLCDLRKFIDANQHGGCNGIHWQEYGYQQYWRYLFETTKETSQSSSTSLP